MSAKPYKLVMAIFPNTRGFAYVVFEGPLAPIDWGISDVRGVGKNATVVCRVDRLVTMLGPDVIVLRAAADLQAPRGRRLRKLVGSLEELAKAKGIVAVQFRREEVRRTFRYLGTPVRYAVARSIAKHIPSFDRYLPPVRQFWRGEDRRMGIFDAAALALTFYRQNPAF
jgi:hypothetical protein